MHLITRLFFRTAFVGAIFVLLFGALALADPFARIENAVARWLLAALFALYWPFFICAAFLTTPEMDDAFDLLLAGSIGLLVVSAGCLYDHFHPQIALDRVHGAVREYDGVKWTMLASLLVGAIFAKARIDCYRPRQSSDKHGLADE